MFEYKFYFNTKEFISFFSEKPFDDWYPIHNQTNYLHLKADANNLSDIYVNMRQCLFIARIEKQNVVETSEQPAN